MRHPVNKEILHSNVLDGPAHLFQKKVFSVNKDLKMDLLTTKIVTMSILGSVSLLIGFIPMLVAKKVSFD